MALHFGRTKNPGTMTFMFEGYWYRGANDEDFQWMRYPEPKKSVRDIRRMWGISCWGMFFGLIRLSKPRE